MVGTHAPAAYSDVASYSDVAANATAIPCTKYICANKAFRIFRSLLLFWKKPSGSQRMPSNSLKKSCNLWSSCSTNVHTWKCSKHHF